MSLGYTQGASFTNPNNQSSDSQSTSIGGSSGFPTPVQTPESYYDQQLAQMAAALGETQYNWAQGIVGQTQGVTNADINAYQAAANNAFGQQKGLQNEYWNAFVPENYALINQAGTYAGPAKMAVNEGAAESGAEQAGATSLNNLKAQLQQYGVNPSAGEWAGLTRATNAETGAAAAGQAEQAERATTQTGLGLLEQAVATGEQLPGAAVNVGNLATENVGGAQNAAIGNETAATGALESAAPYFNSAMQLKLPPVGNVSSSHNMSASNSASQNTGGGGASQQSSSPGGNYGGGGGGGSYNPGYTAALAGAGWPNEGGASSGGGGGSAAAARGGSINWAADDGGVIPDDDATQGGHVPLDASPSMGQQVDDVPARLNAEEFVVPRDVARWKGEEFFQDLINKSRKARMAATAQPEPGPPVGHLPPRFVSQHYGGGRIGAI